MAGREMPDRALLDILDRVDNGQTFGEIGRFYGTTKSAISGIMFRIRRDMADADASPRPRGVAAPQRVENCDGGMPARWWEAGLRARLPARLAPSNRRARG